MSKQDGKDSKLSDSYHETEANREIAVLKKETEEVNREAVIFFSRASRCRLGNWTEERLLESGRIAKPESSLCFEENILVVQGNDPERERKLAFIREHHAFTSNHIMECNSMEDAISKRTGIQMTKHNKKIEQTLDIRADEINVGQEE